MKARSATRATSICSFAAAICRQSLLLLKKRASWRTRFKPSEAIHLLFVGEKLRPEHLLPAPDIQTVNDRENFRVITLEALVEMKLLSNWRRDQVHVLDLIALRLIDSSWLPKLPPVLAERLKLLLHTPDG